MDEAPSLCESGVVGAGTGAVSRRLWIWVRGLLLMGSVVLYGLHFVHLSADFPHNSPWNDWSKYTDEGWYGDGAIRHFVLGHWLLPGDFNPAVAMPVWPLLLAAVFAVTGVSLVAARALAVAVFGVALLALFGLLEQRKGAKAAGSSGLAGLGPSRAAPASPSVASSNPGAAPANAGVAGALAVFLACANPFLFAFDRLAILEPMVAALSVLALWLAASMRPDPEPKAGRGRPVSLGKGAGLGVLLALLGLAKPTAVALFPAVLYLLWRMAGGRPLAAIRLAAVPLAVAAAIWAVYFALLVRFHLLAEYRYLFDANAYTGFKLQPLMDVVGNTLWDGRFVGGWLYGLFALAMAAMALCRRRFFREPLAGALLLWSAGSLLLLGYHNNLQPRYYVLLAVPVIALVAMATEEALAWAMARRSTGWRVGLVAAGVVCVGAVAVAGIGQEVNYLLHPDYSYLQAAQRIAAIVRADPRQSPWVLSVSGSDLTLMTGLPSIDDDFGTLDLDERVRQYRPGWYVAWNEIDDDKMDALWPLYKPVRVAAFPAMDDPDRNLLILYRLDPYHLDSDRPNPYRADAASGAAAHRGSRRRFPPALRTRSGQQPDTPPLRH